MKLKKIASLALAGVMAVSMLAGCKGNNSSSTGDQGNTVVETATGFAKALNDVQIPGTAVQIDFTSDSTFDANLAKAVKNAGENATDVEIQLLLVQYSGIIPNAVNAAALMDENADCEDGKTLTYVSFQKVESTASTTEDAAVKVRADAINADLKTLKKDTYDESKGMGIGSTYYELSYTGKASMAKLVDGDGTVNYYFVTVITQTATKTTKK